MAENFDKLIKGNTHHFNKRMWFLVVDGKDFINPSTTQDFRMTADVIISPGGAYSTMDLRIYNLRRDIAKGNLAPGKTISLAAGFDNNIGCLFVGVIRNLFLEREGPNIVARVTCYSGTEIFDRGQIDASYSGGATLADVIKDLCKEWPRRVYFDDESHYAGITFTSGYMVGGDIVVELDKLAQAYKFSWLQHNGNVHISSDGVARSGPVKQVSASTGMVGFPEVGGGNSGVTLFVVTRLEPNSPVNGRLQVESGLSTFNTGNVFSTTVAGDADANGLWDVIDIRHRMDSHGNQWITEYNAQRANSAPSVSSDGKLVWGAVMSQELRKAFREVGAKLDVNPDWLTSVVAFETGKSFAANEKNKAGSGATGLIQFMPATARSLGYTTAQLARMSAVQQLEGPVYEYFKPYKSKLTSLGATYLAVFYPDALGKGDGYVIATSPSTRYTQNAGLDVARKGFLTAGDAVARAERSYREGQNHAA